MPRGDRTGPDGAGAMSGRAVGYCSGSDRPGFFNQLAGRLFRRRNAAGANRSNSGSGMMRGNRGGRGRGMGRGQGMR